MSPMQKSGSLDSDSKESGVQALIGGGLIDLSFYQTILISGPDAIDYLHRMTTVDFQKMVLGEVAWGAFLTAKAGVVALVLFERNEKSVRIYCPGAIVQTTLAHIEKFHFAEKFECVIESDCKLMGVYLPVEGSETQLGFPTRTASTPDWAPRSVMVTSEYSGWWDSVLPGFFWARIPHANVDRFENRALGAAIPRAGVSVFETVRIKNGMASVPDELSENDIILEGNCTWAVARNKGCYPGQEVVERIFTYGSVNRKLLSVEVSGPMASLPLVIEGVKLVAVAPLRNQTGRYFGLAYVPKAQWSRMEPWKSAEIEITLRTCE